LEAVDISHAFLPPKFLTIAKLSTLKSSPVFDPPCTRAAFNTPAVGTYRVCDEFDSRSLVKIHDVIPCRQTGALLLRLVRLRLVRLEWIQYIQCRNKQRTHNARQYLTTTRILPNDINDQNLQLFSLE